MEVKRKVKGESLMVELVGDGSTFFYEGDLYLKVDKMNSTVNVGANTGVMVVNLNKDTIESILQGTVVTVCSASVVIE